MKKLFLFLSFILLVSTSSFSSSFIEKTTQATPPYYLANRTDIYTEFSMEMTVDKLENILSSEDIKTFLIYYSEDKITINHKRRWMLMVERKDYGAMVTVISCTEKPNKHYNYISKRLEKTLETENKGDNILAK